MSTTGLRCNRKWIAGLSVATLVPLVKAEGELHQGDGIQPSFRTLNVRDLHVIYVEGILVYPRDTVLHQMLDLWPIAGHKSLSVVWEPLKIRCFHGGTWIDTLIDMALELGITSP